MEPNALFDNASVGDASASGAYNSGSQQVATKW